MPGTWVWAGGTQLSDITAVPLRLHNPELALQADLAGWLVVFLYSFPSREIVPTTWRLKGRARTALFGDDNAAGKGNSGDPSLLRYFYFC
jgi:hypothetical protein